MSFISQQQSSLHTVRDNMVMGKYFVVYIFIHFFIFMSANISVLSLKIVYLAYKMPVFFVDKSTK